MKHIQTYEKSIFYSKNDFEIGDYVFINRISKTNLTDFMDENIGKIKVIDYSKRWFNEKIYYVKFKNIPENLLQYFDQDKCYPAKEKDLIKASAKDIENYNIYLTAQKYNL